MEIKEIIDALKEVVLPERKEPISLSKEEIEKLTDEQIIDYLHDGSSITMTTGGRLVCELFLRMKKMYEKIKDKQ